MRRTLLGILITAALVVVGATGASAVNIVGHVYCDSNRNNVIDNLLDIRLEGVRVTVTNTGGTFSGQDVTDSRGIYIIPVSDIPDNYIITLDISTLPPDTVFIIPALNSYPVSVTPPNNVVAHWLIGSDSCVPHACGNGILESGEECDDGNLAAGDGCSPVCTIELASIGGTVWNDLNDNGIQDPGEPGIPGVTVNLMNCSGLIPDTKATDANGNYAFTGLVPGNYNIGFVKPAGFVFSPMEQGPDDNLDSDADPITGQTACTTLEPLENDMSWDAGLYMPFCGNGIRDANEECDDGNNVDGDGCSAHCTSEAPGGEGCTPGYWKQEQHFDSWTAPYTPGTLFVDVFGEDAFSGKTLLDVLKLRGGGLNALGRHIVAALLDAAAPGVDYDLTPEAVISLFQGVYPGTADSYEALKNRIQGLNEQGCPLN